MSSSPEAPGDAVPRETSHSPSGPGWERRAAIALSLAGATVGLQRFFPAQDGPEHLLTFHLVRELQSPDVREAIHRGYEWYRKALFDEQDNPKSFAIAPRLQIVRLEMYNIAEAISLGVLLKDEIPQALALAETLAARLIRYYGLPAGYWVTRVYLGGIKHTVPFLRWPQSQLFLALTNLLVAALPGGNTGSGKSQIPQ